MVVVGAHQSHEECGCARPPRRESALRGDLFLSRAVPARRPAPPPPKSRRPRAERRRRSPRSRRAPPFRNQASKGRDRRSSGTPSSISRKLRGDLRSSAEPAWGRRRRLQSDDISAPVVGTAFDSRVPRGRPPPLPAATLPVPAPRRRAPSSSPRRPPRPSPSGSRRTSLCTFTWRSFSTRPLHPPIEESLVDVGVRVHPAGNDQLPALRGDLFLSRSGRVPARRPAPPQPWETPAISSPPLSGPWPPSLPDYLRDRRGRKAHRKCPHYHVEVMEGGKFFIPTSAGRTPSAVTTVPPRTTVSKSAIA